MDELLETEEADELLKELLEAEGAEELVLERGRDDEFIDVEALGLEEKEELDDELLDVEEALGLEEELGVLPNVELDDDILTSRFAVFLN